MRDPEDDDEEDEDGTDMPIVFANRGGAALLTPHHAQRRHGGQGVLRG